MNSNSQLRTVCVVSLLVLIAAPAQAVRFRLPLSSDTGVHYYYDHNTSSGLTAWNCSGTTYNGHQGTDYSGGPRGRAILAAANGSLNYKIDGFGDGFVGSTAGGGAGNHVRLDHGGGVMTWYMHMTAGSVTGKGVGSGIACSEQIGGVGTSGSSSGLHLHFDLRLNGARRDPYIGSCGGSDYWVSQGSGSPSTACESSGSGPATFSDFDGDGKADSAIWRPSNGDWHISKSTGGTMMLAAFGYASDIPVAADYDGDHKVDSAVWRPSTGYWYISKSTGGTMQLASFGYSTDIPVPADYDGDGKTDSAIWRPSTGLWSISKSTGGTMQLAAFGYSTDIPVPADYDGDGKTDSAVWRPSTGYWYISKSTGGTMQLASFGYSTDIPVPADYDGDGKTDSAIWRPSTGLWSISKSTGGVMQLAAFGYSTDIPVPADYDGDGKTDSAVWRPSTGYWYISKSTGGTMQLASFGYATDVPVPLPYAVRRIYYP